MEASALRAPAGLSHRPVARLLRLRSDDQLVALFRLGNEEAFSAIHDRYRARLLAYTRQMLAGSRSDAEDALQDVFLRAYSALRADHRPVTLRAWLYRVAHNRCIDQLRRPGANVVELFDTARGGEGDDLMAVAQRREDLRRLVADVGRLPEQQRSALLMREMEGLTYQELADALQVTVPAVKSLLVRARMGLVEAQAARDTACVDIRTDIAAAHDRGVRASSRARRHMRECAGCREYRAGLRGVAQGLSALQPGPGGWGLVAKVFGIGGAGSGAAAGGTAAIGGGAAAVTATKVAAVVCCAALVGGGAAEVRHVSRDAPAPAAHAATPSGPAAPAVAAPLSVKVLVGPDVPPMRVRARHARRTAGPGDAVAPVAALPGTTAEHLGGPGSGAQSPADVAAAQRTGGILAPDEDPADAAAPGASGDASPAGGVIGALLGGGSTGGGSTGSGTGSSGASSPSAGSTGSGAGTPSPAGQSAAASTGSGSSGGSSASGSGAGAPTAQGASASPAPAG